jgi:hypothetical protein
MLNGLKLGSRLGRVLAIALLVVAGSCKDAPTAPTKPSNAEDPSRLLGLWGSPKLLYCPSTETQSTSGLLDVAGGTLSLGGTSVKIPLGALSGPTTVELSIPAGQYMEVDLTVNGGQHTIFPQPVVVTVDYSRCNRWQTLLRLLTVWNIDQDTKALLQNMGGIDNKLAQSITFSTLHFSGFAIAY